MRLAKRGGLAEVLANDTEGCWNDGSFQISKPASRSRLGKMVRHRAQRLSHETTGGEIAEAFA